MRTMHSVAFALLVLLPAARGLSAKAPRQAAVAPVTDPCAALPPATDPGFLPRLTDYMNNFCYRTADWQHDAHVRTSEGVHPYVKVYYSPSMWTWMTTDHRMGDVPDGAILVKEQYHTLDGPLFDWSIMVKDHTGAWDGWYWADIGVPSTPAPPPSPPQRGCNEAVFSYTGFGLYCLNCHASAAAGQGTFATTEHVMQKAGPQAGPPIFDDIHQPLWNPAGRELSAGLPDSALPAWSAIFANVRPLPGSSQSKPPCMVPESFDHVVAGKKPQGPEGFLTSDQCAGCHNATGTLSTNPQRPDLPSMLYPDAIAPTANLSIYGEWRYSMMGLAGRDPIFFAQLDTESTVHANLKDHPTDAPVFVQDRCLHCHGVMGQRQYQLDTGERFPRSELQDPNSKYGALGRDGVSCTVCHRVAAEGLGTPESFSGDFKIGPPGEVYGPYQDVATLPMKNALGVKPLDGQQIKDSQLCGSCHTVIIPVYNRQGERVMEDGKPKFFDEQATFYEWLNSSLVNISCTECHMPTEYEGHPLAYKIANIEDNTFPHFQFQAPDVDITLKVRDPYPRHTLLGINVFALEMFGQFRTELGLYDHDPYLPGADLDKVASGQETAIKSSLEIAKTTAEVSIVSATKNQADGTLHADVLVKNLTGHSLPSGVGFRRAFLNFQVLDSAGNILWASGNTSPQGVIVDGSGNPLKTEFFSPDQQEFQPHFWAGTPEKTGNPITREDQVQIYEELIRDPSGLLTTSFFSLDEKAKDNRLQPHGWSPTGPFAHETAPVGTGSDTDYQNGSGSNTVRYDVSLGAKVDNAAYVRATLYYQTIPPYYLRQRSQDAHGPDTQRLVDFVAGLKVEGTPVESWRLPIATAMQFIGQ